MKTPFKKFSETIGFVADLFGASQAVIYIAGLASTLLIGAGVFVFDSALFGVYSLLALWAVFVVYRFLKWRVSEENRIARTINPGIRIKSHEIECEITSEKGCVRNDVLIFEATRDGVDNYRFFVYQTAAKGIELVAVEGGRLLVSRDYSEKIQYRIEFDKLARNKEKRISMRWKIESLADAPYFFQTLRCVFDALKFSVTFPKKIVGDSVAIYTEDAAGGMPVGDLEKINLEEHGTNPEKSVVVWKIAKGETFPPDTGLKYVLSWKWK